MNLAPCSQKRFARACLMTLTEGEAGGSQACVACVVQHQRLRTAQGSEETGCRSAYCSCGGVEAWRCSLDCHVFIVIFVHGWTNSEESYAQAD